VKQALEIEAVIDEDGLIRVPEQYRQWYGKPVKVLVLTPREKRWQAVDLMKYSGTVDWPVDGVEYQREIRVEHSL